MSAEWFRVRDSFDHNRVPQLVQARWAGDPDSVRFVSSAYNIVFRFERDGRGHYLRVCHTVLHKLEKARQVMHFLRYLAAQGVPVGEPIPAASGDFIEVLADGFFVSAQIEAPGEKISRHLHDLAIFEAWGGSLGKLHAASRQYRADTNIPYQFPTVQRFWQNIAPAIRNAPAEMQRAYAELTDWMQGLPPHDYGLIHGDHRPGNVIWDGTIARTIDFDEPNYHWYAADISRALAGTVGKTAGGTAVASKSLHARLPARAQNRRALGGRSCLFSSSTAPCSWSPGLCKKAAAPAAPMTGWSGGWGGEQGVESTH